MKTIGLLGGMSWESTVGYYQIINRGVKKALGNLHSAKIVMYSVDFEPVQQLQHAGDWQGTADILCDASKKIEAGGADFLVICTNTMHKVAPDIEKAITIPVLHIADATAEFMAENSVQTVGLLGTAFTMEQDFYKGRLQKKHGLNVLVPNEADRKIVHSVIYNELCLGSVRNESRREFLRIIDDLAAQGGGAVILGCTEIGILVKQNHTGVLLCDTTVIHAEKAVEYALGR